MKDWENGERKHMHLEERKQLNNQPSYVQREHNTNWRRQNQCQAMSYEEEDEGQGGLLDFGGVM